MQKIDPAKARVLIASGEAQALDLRGEDAWRESHVPGAVHSAPEEVGSHADELKRGSAVVVVADDEDAARKAAEALRDEQLDVALLDGGMKAWSREKLKTEPSVDPADDAPIEPDAAR